MGPTEGLVRGMEVISTEAPISVPVGKETLGRMFNVLGEPIDGLPPVKDAKNNQLRLKSSKLVSKLSTFFAHMLKVARSVCSVVLVLAKPF